MAKKTPIKCGIVDGAVSGLLLFLLGEYTVSTFYTYSYSTCYVVAFVFSFVSILSFFSNIKHIGTSIVSYYLSGRIILAFSILLIFFNYLFLHIHVFPRRELGNADGLVLIIVEAIFLLISELVRLFSCILIKLSNIFLKKQ